MSLKNNLLRLALVACMILPQSGLVFGQEDVISKIDRTASDYHARRLFNGAILVAESGRVIYKKGFGYANMEWQIPNSPTTRFRIGSVTKQFTAALILKLVEKGEMSLSGRISDYLPDYPKDQGDRVTIHQLLTHSSGIPSYTSMPEFFPKMSRDPSTPAAFTDLFSGLDLEFEPGSEFRYNNSGYFLLGVIIEALTGKSYAEILQAWILDPFVLRDTGYDRHDRIIANRAAGYEKTLSGYQNANYLDMSLPYAAGSMYSTVEDLYKWDQVLYSDKLFSKSETKSLMMTPHIEGYGYGLVIRDMAIGENGRSAKMVEHGGGINGFTTGFRRLVEERHFVAIVDNTRSSNVGDLMDDVVEILYGEAPDPPQASIAEELMMVIAARGIGEAVNHYDRLKREKNADYDFSEDQLNQLGYYYLEREEIATAIAVFELNVAAYPDASNPYDSLGEAHMKSGNKEKAIANFRKSVALNPDNENGKMMLKRLSAGSVPDDQHQ